MRGKPRPSDLVAKQALGEAVELWRGRIARMPQESLPCPILASVASRCTGRTMLIGAPPHDATNLAMKRLQAFKYELQPNGEQQRAMSRFAGSCRFVFNKALALQ